MRDVVGARSVLRVRVPRTQTAARSWESADSERARSCFPSGLPAAASRPPVLGAGGRVLGPPQCCHGVARYTPADFGRAGRLAGKVAFDGSRQERNCEDQLPRVSCFPSR